MQWHQERENFYLGDPTLTIGGRTTMAHTNGKALRTAREHAPVVLILEDFDAIRAYLKNHFKMQGYDVLSAATIRDAVELAEHEYPQIVIIDYDLNSEDAYEAIRRLRTTLPLSYIVLMGGPDTAKIEENAKRSGASRVLAKAYELGELDGAVMGALKTSAQVM